MLLQKIGNFLFLIVPKKKIRSYQNVIRMGRVVKINNLQSGVFQFRVITI